MADEKQLKPGSVVQLNSGGPHMTVVTVKGTEVFCCWFENAKTTPQTYTFLAAMLTLIV